jgi:hypothetical protein
MNARRLIAVAPAGLAAGAAMVVPAAVPALAAPPADGCPAAHQLRSVRRLTGEGSQAPAQVDSPAGGVAGEGQGWMGQSGDGDGFAGGVKPGGQLIRFGLPVGNFTGNQFAPLT